jgi:conjugative relaxase-like TrwC/TraI family protein
MSMCVRYAGDSYTYLLDSVTTDHGRAGASPMTRYYAARGTPPGSWLGAGLAGLAGSAGLTPGSAVTPAQMERLFADGADPVTGLPLGRSPHLYSRPGDRRRPVAGFDHTFTVPKSVSVLWALADEQTREALYGCHRQAITDVLALVERDVARTRIGTNGIAQVAVAGVVAAAFDHWDSRENDPNLHTHVVVANRVQGPDGRWRTLDSRAVHRAVVAMSERYDAILADLVTQRLGLGWDYRERGAGRNPAYVLAAVPASLVELFSRRGAAIDAETDRLIAAWVDAHGRRPDPAAVLRLRQQATLATRGPKELRSLEDLTDEWHRRGTACLGADARGWAALALASEAAGPVPDPGVTVGLADAASLVLAALTARRSTWTAWNVEAEATRALRARRFASQAERDTATAELVAEVVRRSVLLTPPEVAPVPAGFRRSDGSSAFRPHRAERYTSPTILDAERRLLAAGRDPTAPSLDAGGLVGDALTGLDGDQFAAVRAVACSGRVVDVLVGPAGSGKTHTLAALRAAWERAHGPGSVVGLAPSAAAADVLASSIGIETENTAKWLVEHDAEPERLRRFDHLRAALTRGDRSGAIAAEARRLAHEIERWRFHPGQLVLVDEASLAGTLALDRIAACAGEAGAKLLLVGDWAQLSAIEAGGAFGLLVRDRGPEVPELGAPRRFTQAWERAASVQLRTGDPAAVDAYLAHDRVTHGDRDSMLDTAFAAWAADEAAGKRSLLLAGDRDTVRALNERARADLVAAGLVDLAGTRLRDDLLAGVGDRVVTRRNDRRLVVGDGWVKNGDQWTVTARDDDGVLTVRRAAGGPAVRLPAAYVAEHVDLGYATTAYRAQGATVDTAHAVVTGTSLTREVLYVMLTRARDTNRAYVCTDRPVEPLPGFADEPTTARDVLLAVLGHVGATTSAHETRDIETETAASIRTLAAEYETLAHHAQAPRWRALLTAAGLAPSVVADIEESPAYGAVSVALRRADGHALPVDRAMPRLTTGLDRAVHDPAAVLHARVQRWTNAAVTAGRGRPASLVAGLIPAARGVSDSEMAAALHAREQLMEQRADQLLDRARAASAPWLRRLGAPPDDHAGREAWQRRARAVAAYRDRYAITDSHRPLGRASVASQQQQAERDLAAQALVAHSRAPDSQVRRRVIHSSEPPAQRRQTGLER